MCTDDGWMNGWMCYMRTALLITEPGRWHGCVFCFLKTCMIKITKSGGFCHLKKKTNSSISPPGLRTLALGLTTLYFKTVLMHNKKDKKINIDGAESEMVSFLVHELFLHVKTWHLPLLWRNLPPAVWLKFRWVMLVTSTVALSHSLRQRSGAHFELSTLPDFFSLLNLILNHWG